MILPQGKRHQDPNYFLFSLKLFRVLYQGLHITRYPSYMSRYKMLLHEKDTPSKKRFQLLGDAINRFKTDGLNSLEYQVIKKERRSLFSWFLVSFKVQ